MDGRLRPSALVALLALSLSPLPSSTAHADEAKADKDDDDGQGEKGKDKKKSADEELFGGDDKKDIDPARLEVHMKGERSAARAKVTGILEGAPMTDDLREELRRHALMTAKLMRIRQLALAAKDTASVTKVNALVKRETARHVEFIEAYKTKHAAKGGAK